MRLMAEVDTAEIRQYAILPWSGPRTTEFLQSAADEIDLLREKLAEVQQAAVEVCPEAIEFNSLPEIVRGIGRQRDWQAELKDHLALTAQRLTTERDANRAELARWQLSSQVWRRRAVDARPELATLRAQLVKVRHFTDERAGYIKALKNSPNADCDYHRWSGNAEARRQLAQQMGWPVAHCDKDGRPVEFAAPYPQGDETSG